MFNTTYYNALQHAHPGVVRVFLFLFLRISQSSTRKTHSTSFTVQCIQLNPEKKKGNVREMRLVSPLFLHCIVRIPWSTISQFRGFHGGPSPSSRDRRPGQRRKRVH